MWDYGDHIAVVGTIPGVVVSPDGPPRWEETPHPRGMAALKLVAPRPKNRYRDLLNKLSMMGFHTRG